MSSIKTEKHLSHVQGAETQKSFLEIIIKDVKKVRLPSLHWDVCVHSKSKSLDFSSKPFEKNNQNTYKSVKLIEIEHLLEIETRLNNTLVEIPHIAKTVSTVEELSNILQDIDMIQTCKYYSIDNKENKCLIYSLPLKDVCNYCYNKTLDIKNKYTEKWLQEAHRNTSINNGKLCNINHAKSVECILCQKTFRTEEDLTSHKRVHFPQNKNGKFECTVCCKTLDDTNSIFKHYKDHHVAVKFIKCTICKRTFNNLKLLKIHISNHTNDKPVTNGFSTKTKKQGTSKDHVCTICKTKYSTIRLLHQHQKEHQKYVPLKCNGCHIIFDNENQAVAHKMKCKKKKLKYICKICEKKFACISQKMCHMKAVHSIEYLSKQQPPNRRFV